MIKANVYVTLKPSVLDPQGKVITQTLHGIGFESVKETRVSKFIELTFDSDNEEKVKEELKKICDKVLANPNTETFSFELEKKDE
ncbi:MAG: phosphoribosylformylglycinamidine synthase [Candidatus Cloacimonadota bacterium]|nr:MAG: phosphoribosylformylglycinamidine synthase [Candidatus Cloacimonadota bacterium]